MSYSNVPMSEKAMEEFCSTNNLESLIKKPTCYKNHQNPTCIDLIFTNRPDHFHNVLETGISDFHLLTSTQIKMGFQKNLPKITAYHDYKKFDNAKFCDDVNSFDFDQFDVCNFMEVIFNVLDKSSPIKQ